MPVRRVAAFLFAVATPVLGSSPHEFCVSRNSPAGNDVVRTRFHFGAADPGRAAASLLLVRHYRQPGIISVEVDAYDSATCAATEVQDIALTARPERIPDRAPVGPVPNLGRVADLASGAVTGIAEQASRLMCRLLPC